MKSAYVRGNVDGGCTLGNAAFQMVVGLNGEQAPVLQRIRVPAASPGERPAFSPSLIASLVEFTREYVRAAGRDRWTPTDSDAMRRH